MISKILSIILVYLRGSRCPSYSAATCVERKKKKGEAYLVSFAARLVTRTLIYTRPLSTILSIPS